MTREPEAGAATIAVAGVGAAVGLVLLVVVLDIAAYLAAASGAQAAADNAALAAVAITDPRGGQEGSAVAAAGSVATAAGARLDRCDCAAGRREVAVEVSLPVRGILITRYAATRVTARSRAHLVPP